MRDTERSLLRFYSLGLVANNKAMSEKTIQVTPHEQLTMIDGELASIPTDVETQGTDASGQSYSTKVKTDNAIEATWLPMNSNRRTAPDVRRGERVLIWQYGDTDQYYWTELGWDDHLRKLETVIYSISGTTDEAVDGTQPGNCYSLEMSTHGKNITIRTSKLNEEYCVYGVQIDTANGRVMIVDDLDNEFYFDSKNTNIWMKNADGTKVELNKKVLNMFAPDAINVEATNSIKFKTKDYSIKCDTYKLEAQTFSNECQTGTFKGVYTFENPVTFNASIAAKGAAEFSGAAEFTQQIQANGIVSSAPIVGPSDTI